MELSKSIESKDTDDFSFSGVTKEGLLEKTLNELSFGIEQKFREMKTMVRLMEYVNSDVLLDEVLDSVFDEFQDLIPYDRMAVAMISENSKSEKIVVSKWQRSKSNNVLLKLGFSAALEGSTLKNILLSRKPRIISDLNEYLKNKPESLATKLIVQEGFQSNLTCPIEASNQVVGFIFFTSRKKNSYNNLEILLYQNIAKQLSLLVERSLNYEKMLRLIDSKNRMMGIVAHDLRNPLAVISGYTEILSMDTRAFDEKQKNYLRIIGEVTNRAIKLVNDLVDFSVIGAGRLKLDRHEVNLYDFISKLMDHYMILAESKKLRLKLVNEIKDGVTINFDEYRAEQAIGNLLSNAFKFSTPGKEVELKFSMVEANGVERGLEIAVKDEGPGIESKHLSRIFDEFETFDEKHKMNSAGLGLSIVKSIVQAHQGNIKVNSEPGKGAQFILFFPR